MSSSVVKAGREAVRYLGNRKVMINPNPALEIMKNHRQIAVTENIVHCDGGNPRLGHPRVYINLDKGQNTCGYCGQKFNYDKSHHH